jgi:hypothetical protein
MLYDRIQAPISEDSTTCCLSRAFPDDKLANKHAKYTPKPQ